MLVIYLLHYKDSNLTSNFLIVWQVTLTLLILSTSSKSYKLVGLTNYSSTQELEIRTINIINIALKQIIYKPL
jgi:diketogulonate reductase-like aldo/keto reductase